MLILIIGIIGAVLGIWSLFSPGTLFVVILTVALLYIFSLNFKELPQKRFVITICTLAICLRFLVSIFNYLFSSYAGIGIDFIPDARAYSASGQYIAEAITHAQFQLADDNEPRWVDQLRTRFKGQLPPYEYRVDTFPRFVGWFYSVFGYDPTSIKFINSFLSLITSILLFFWVKNLFSIKVANITLALNLFWPSLILWSATGAKDSFVLFLLTFCIYIYLNHLKKYLNPVESLILLVIIASPSMLVSLLFFVGIIIIRICRKKVFKIKISQKIFIFLVLVLIMKPAFFFLKLTRFYLSIILLWAFFLSVISFLKKKTIIVLLIISFGVALLYPFYKNDNIDVNRIFRASARKAIETQYSQTISANSGYKIYPEELYYNQNLNISFSQCMLSYLKGIAFALLSPFPFSNINNIRNSIPSIQSLLFYILLPFIIIGIFVALRYKWRDVFMVIIFIFITSSLFALTEGNMGTAFRHRDMLTGFFLVFGAIGISKAFGLLNKDFLYY